MNKFSLNVTKGHTLHFWVKSKAVTPKTFLSIYSSSKKQPLCFKIQNVPYYYEFYSYQHSVNEEIEIEIDLANFDISLAYIFDPKVVEEEGVTYFDFSNNTIKLLSHKESIHNYQLDNLRPKLHFTPNSGWMNDPNGLCFHDGKYHMFYQYYPNSLDWGPMHWGHAVSENLMDWRHLPVFLQPEQNLESLAATGGAFSGTAFTDPNDGELSFFFTERKAAYDLNHSYREVQKRAFWDNNHTIATKVSTVLDNQPEFVHHDFRDPKVWFDPNDNLYKMILGSAVDKTPAILLYHSPDKENWKFESVLYQTPEYFERNSGRCVECPDFIQFGDIWVVIYGVVGYHEQKTGRHNLLYAVPGRFSNNVFTSITDPQCLDFGTDFYAMQSFNDGCRQLAFAWLHNWAVKGHIHPQYNGEMSVPRELTLSKDNALLMRPTIEVDQKLADTHPYSGELIALEEKNQSVFSIEFNQIDGDFSINLLGENTSINISFDNKSIKMIEKKLTGEDFSYELSPTSSDAKFSSQTSSLDNIRIIFDHGIVEVFCNNGRICGTRRYVNTLSCRTIITKGNLNDGEIRFIK
ncbi:TPA: GH32 C-terminal domain-containing protein [Vibrio cholerae]|nr:glycoside hydrolase family 32 protein [Vibrio cholerae]